jgi:uncharacterized protein involved in exopolysaccharide biosynthesis
LRTGRAEDTLEFFRQEVGRLSAELDTQSARITEFQSENADALPGDQQFRMNRLELLQERLATAERQRNALRDQRARLTQIFEETGNFLPAEGVELTRDQQLLQQLEQQLADARLVYSETSPRVEVLRTRIERLRERIDQDVAPGLAEGGGVDGERSTGEALLQAQLAQIDSEIETLENFMVETTARMEELEDSIARTPETAIILRGLERDYANIRAQYDNAVTRLAAASTGERIEVTARGQRISIIEAASVPQRPTNQNTLRTIVMGFAAGLALAGGLFALMEILNRAIRRPIEITNGLGITPIATIPLMETPRRRTLRRGAYIASFVVILVGLPVVLWAVDSYFMPLDQLATAVLRRVGLT